MRDKKVQVLMEMLDEVADLMEDPDFIDVSQEVDRLKIFVFTFGLAVQEAIPYLCELGLRAEQLKLLEFIDDVSLFENKFGKLLNENNSLRDRLLEQKETELKESQKAAGFFSEKANQFYNEAEKDVIRKRNSGESTKDKYLHITLVAVRVIQKYAEKYPEKLNKDKCERGVLTRINESIQSEMSKPENMKKACLFKVPEDKTITKHRREAFKYLELYDPNDHKK
jgi:hypothetical protein